MKKIAIVCVSVILSSAPVLAEKKMVVGSYNGGEVTEQQVMQEFKPMIEMQAESKGKSFSQFDKKLQEALVRSYINQKLFAEEATRLGIENSQEFKEKLKMIKSQILQQELIESYLKKTVTDKMIDEEYNNLVKNLTGQKEVKVSHILLDTEERAKKIKKKLNKGAKFASLAKEFSKDKLSKDNNGELAGYVIKGQLVPEFESKAFSMKKGEISYPVKSEFGWHLIEVLDVREAQIPTKEQAMNDIRTKLSREAIEKYLATLIESAKVKIDL